MSAVQLQDLNLILLLTLLDAIEGNYRIFLMKWYHYCASNLGFYTALPGYNSCHCQVLPSEYAYLRDSVHHSESMSANSIEIIHLHGGAATAVHLKNYIHCDGTTLRLSDSDIGSEQYTSSDYYVWTPGLGNIQLLFIFPTRVNLTTITLHYYSDSVKGLPRLRFYAVPDYFHIWDASTSIYYDVVVAAVPPDEEPAGHKNVSVGFNVTTMKLLMHKSSSIYSFAVSEVNSSVIPVSRPLACSIIM